MSAPTAWRYGAASQTSVYVRRLPVSDSSIVFSRLNGPRRNAYGSNGFRQIANNCRPRSDYGPRFDVDALNNVGTDAQIAPFFDSNIAGYMNTGANRSESPQLAIVRDSCAGVHNRMISNRN